MADLPLARPVTVSMLRAAAVFYLLTFLGVWPWLDAVFTTPPGTPIALGALAVGALFLAGSTYMVGTVFLALWWLGVREVTVTDMTEDEETPSC